MKAGAVWIVLRFAAVAAITAALMSIPVARSNLDWGAGVFIGIIVSVALFLWLTAIRSREDVDWSQPFSLTQPFFPMTGFPLRYWFVASCSLAIGGAATTLRDLIEHNGRQGVGGSFLIAGLFIAVTLTLWIRAFARRLPIA
jgi:hypothetical protein